MENPITGETLTEAERASVAARFAEAGRLWRAAVAYAGQTLDEIEDPHQRLIAIGVHAAGLIAAEVASHDDLPDPDGFATGLMVGVIAFAAHDGAEAIQISRAHRTGRTRGDAS